MSAPGGRVSVPRGCLLSGGSAPGECLLPGGLLPGGVCSGECLPPPMNRMTDRCKNITLPQLHCGR